MTAISEIKRVDIDVECAIGDVPINVLATAVNDDQIDVAWTNTNTELAIQVFRDNALIDTIPAGTTSYEDTGLASLTEYCYRLSYVGAGLRSTESCATTFNSFVFEVNTANAGDSANDQFTLPLFVNGTYNFTVDWGDGNRDVITTHNQTETQHTYSSSGAYTVRIGGTCQGFSFSDTTNDDDSPKVTEISKWGQLTRAANQIGDFDGCSNLTVTATDVFDVTGSTSISLFFRGCSSLTTVPSINSWDISGITNLSSCFDGCTLFNSSLSSWNTSSVTTMATLFRNCITFNQNIDSWNVGSVTNFVSVFDQCAAFNQPLNSWDMSSATTLVRMFRGASDFNQSLSSWDVTGVTTFQELFSGCSDFNQNINAWTTTALTNLDSCFASCTSFNQSVNGWDVDSVTTFAGCFLNCSAFNQPLNSWVVSSATNFSLMFQGATIFDQDITGWTTTAATNFDSMFQNANAFDQDIGSWDTSGVTTFVEMFSGASISFNQDIGGWDVTSLTNATNMFSGGSSLSTTNYDNLLVGWEAQAVNNNVVFDAGNATYTSAGAGGTARAALIADHSWTITDGGGV